jgi:hypothetical protein
MGCVGDAYTFDPVVLGDRECDAWVHYYRREWAPFLRDSLGLVSEGFGLGPRRTLVGAWLVLRANQVWAPYPDNDADAAREYMRRFYALVVADGSLDLDPVEAARREVQWWHLHRVHQRENDVTETQLVDAVAHLYGYVYAVPEPTGRWWRSAAHSSPRTPPSAPRSTSRAWRRPGTSPEVLGGAG